MCSECDRDRRGRLVPPIVAGKLVSAGSGMAKRRAGLMRRNIGSRRKRSYFGGLGLAWSPRRSSVAPPLRPARPQAKSAPKAGVIAVEGPMTGEQASTGIDMADGAQLAVDQINGAGGLNGVQLTVLKVNDDATAVGGLAAAKKVARHLRLRGRRPLQLLRRCRQSPDLQEGRPTADCAPHSPASRPRGSASRRSPWIPRLHPWTSRRSPRCSTHSIPRSSSTRRPTPPASRSR